MSGVPRCASVRKVVRNAGCAEGVTACRGFGSPDGIIGAGTRLKQVIDEMYGLTVHSTNDNPERQASWPLASD
jgi:hypothetical protein